MDAMSRALRKAARSPFSTDIEHAPMPDRFTRPSFNSYDRKTDPVEHKGSIRSFAELIQEFGVRFVTCSRVPQPVDALLSMKMRVGETLRNYASRYWELYNEIGEGNEKIAASTFRMGLPKESGLRESLTKKPPEDMGQLMRRIEEYKRLEDDRLQSKGKAPMINRPRQNSFPPRIRGNVRIQEPEAPAGELAEAGYLKEFVTDARDQGAGQGTPYRGNLLPPPLGIIEVIHAPTKKCSTARGKGVYALATAAESQDGPSYGKRMKPTKEPIAFDDSDLEGTVQPHDDALVVYARIGGFLVKRVMIDQGSGADVIYPDLFRGLGLRSADLSEYGTPLVGFDGKIVIPEGQISLPVNMEGREVVVTFIVVASFSLYTAILGKPWIHEMGAVPSTLHVKVKFPSEQGVTVVRGSQQTARQCLVALVDWRKESFKQGKSTEEEEAQQNIPL
nr:uncharacterized protein LOC112022246 [Quercus suber]